METDVQIPPSALGYIYLPNDALHIDVVDKSCEVAIRDGRLYNLTDRTFVWETPTNLVASPNDFSDAVWVKTDVAVTHPAVQVRGPHNGPEVVSYLRDTAGAAGTGQNTQTLATALTAGTRYEVSVYLRNGVDLGAANPIVTLSNSSGPVAAGNVRLTEVPPTGNITGESSTYVAQLNAEDAQIIILDAPQDETFATPNNDTSHWVQLKYEYLAAGTGPWTLSVRPDVVTSTPAGPDMYAIGAQIAPAGVSPVRLDVVRCLPYEQLPPVARSYVTAEAMLDLHEALIGTTNGTAALREKAEKALGALMKEEVRASDANLLEDSFSVSRVIGQGLRRNPLRGQRISRTLSGTI
jgi:hypothetical protein